MRRLLIAILLATTAATPALAQSSGNDRRAEREAARAEREAVKQERSQSAQSQRPSRQERQAERPQREFQPSQADAPQRQLTGGPSGEDARFMPRRPDERGRPAIDRAAERGRPSTQQPLSAEEQWERQGRANAEARRQERDSVANWRQEQREQMRDSRRGDVADLQERLARRDRDFTRPDRPPRVTPPAGARPNVPAPPPPTATQSRPAPQWATHWRGDRRYDWRDYRHRNRSLFHLGFYFDPFGWNYNRWGIGWRLWPSYYHRSYWLDDPWMYRLPYAPWPYKWVRYWNDALLVDTFSGRVVDVEYDFFW